MRGQSRGDMANILPPWVVDPNVKDLLASEGIELVILQDEKYRRGDCSKPLILLRRVSPQNQYYSLRCF